MNEAQMFAILGVLVLRVALFVLAAVVLVDDVSLWLAVMLGSVLGDAVFALAFSTRTGLRFILGDAGAARFHRSMAADSLRRATEHEALAKGGER